MSKEIKINKDWYYKLIVIVDNLSNSIKLGNGNIDTHGWLSHLIGYVHSLDEHFKDYSINNEIVTAGKEYINIGVGLMPTIEKQYIVKTENQRIVYENIKYQLDKMWDINN